MPKKMSILSCFIIFIAVVVVNAFFIFLLMILTRISFMLLSPQSLGQEQDQHYFMFNVTVAILKLFGQHKITSVHGWRNNPRRTLLKIRINSFVRNDPSIYWVETNLTRNAIPEASRARCCSWPSPCFKRQRKSANPPLNLLHHVGFHCTQVREHSSEC